MRRFRLIVITVFIAAIALVLSGCFGPGFGGGGGQSQKVKAGPVVSPDGTQLLFVATHDGDPEIYRVNTDGSELLKLTDNSSLDLDPTWGPDGNVIYFSSDRGGSFELYRMNPDGSQAQEITTSVEGETTQ
jgi:Tol biopolymer transport system component